MHDWTKDWYTAQYVVRQGWKWLVLALFGLFLTPLLARPAILGVPYDNLVISGVSVISGWKCEAVGELTIRFNGGTPIPLLHGAQRPDVLNAGACSHDRVGFLTIWNWGNLEPGQYEAIVYDAGVEFDRATFEVVSPGVQFLQGVNGQGTIHLSNGQEAHVQWVEALQGFIAVDYTDVPTDEDSQSPTNQLSGDVCTTRRGLIIEDPDEDTGRWDVTNPCAPWQGYPNVLHIDIVPLTTYGYYIDIDEIVIEQGNIEWIYDYGDGGTAVWVDRETGASIDAIVLPYRLSETPYKTTLLLGNDTGVDLSRPFTLYYDNQLVATFE